jgi:hypothetical protein
MSFVDDNRGVGGACNGAGSSPSRLGGLDGFGVSDIFDEGGGTGSLIPFNLYS